jgi:uncharacterized membrane protein
MIRWVLMCAALTILAFAGSAYVYTNAETLLPAKVPTHFGFSGEPDAWTAREDLFWYLFAPPLGMVAVCLLFPLLPWLSPKQFELDGSSFVFGYMMVLVVALFAYLHAALLLAYTGTVVAAHRWIFGGIAAFLALTGLALGKVPRNFWIGVRTPWTLASERVWVRTHQVAAWMFVAVGVLGLTGAVLGVTPWVYLVLIAVAALLPVAYSLVIYKRLAKLGKA